MEQLIDIGPTVIGYDIHRFDFAAIVRNMLGCEDLSRLSGDEYEMFTLTNDQSSEYHKLFYANFEPQMGPLYREFAAHMAARAFPDRQVLYQTAPTFRVHLPNNVAVGEMHRDGDYRHQDGELNFLVPLTPMWGSNTIWIESIPDSGHFDCWPLEPGQVLVFDGCNLRHGNKPNSTGRSRVSFDMRLLPVDRYVDSGAVSVSLGQRMAPGDYWSEFL